MRPGRPSRTALGAARHRAAHQAIERGRIFEDPLALRILGAAAEEAVREAQRDASRRRLRPFIAVRSRLAEEALAAAVAHGASQFVILGAGLDTFAYRPATDRGALHVFEVDHPATQAWKRGLLAEAGISPQRQLTYVPLDFERESLEAGLCRAGFDPLRLTFFSWLGVVPYLREAAVFATLRFVASLPGGAHIIFDYGNPASPEAPPDQAREALTARVASVGEDLKTRFQTEPLQRELFALGFRAVEDLGPAAIRRRFFGVPEEAGSERGGHVIRASTV